MSAHDRLRIVMMAAEAVPYAKVGGLGDVVGALPKALEKAGAQATVVIPAYRAVHSGAFDIRPCETATGFEVPMGPASERAEIYETEMPGSSVKVYLVGSAKYFDRPGVYDDPETREGYPDNIERFIFFMKSGLQLLERLGEPVDVIHCHDSHTALVPGLIRLVHRESPFFAGVGTLLTIHNLAHQGLYGREALDMAGIDQRHFHSMSPFEYWGQVNFMKAGIELADKVNTVSQTYAAEIQSSDEFGMGLEGVLQNRKDDLSGIVNGIDCEEWNPASDPLITERYTARKLSGKSQCKRHLLDLFGLPKSRKRVPLIGIVSRLADQKGFDLIEDAIEEIVGLGVQFVVLGTGQQKYHDLLERVALQHPENVAVQLAFDNVLAHKIEAGADFFLMPSKFEPCGLNQLFSLRYGTIPIVRTTGGLADTVIPYDGEGGTGFRFSEYSVPAMMAAIKEGLSVYADSGRWRTMVQRAMAQDWSWDRSAGEYLKLYGAIRNRSRQAAR